MTKLYAAYSFHPIGQGLFSSGILIGDEGVSGLFRWVYDCGTSSSPRLINQAVTRFKRGVAGQSSKIIDLLTISHFDKDHINGLTILLSKNVRVRTLLLPYMPLWQRLHVAAAERVSSNEPLFDFFMNPVAYITTNGGNDIDQIILVLPSDGSGPPEGSDETAPPLHGEGPWQLDFSKAQPVDKDQQNLAKQQAKAGPLVQFMRPGSALGIAGLWEFVPYNDATLAPKATHTFRKQIADLQYRLLYPPAGSNQDKILNDIKHTYDATFGTGAKNRNDISLFLYSGPLGKWHEVRPLKKNSYPWPISERESLGSNLGGRPKISVLYTGDGYLNTPTRADRLIKYLGLRAKWLGAVQVMHHGARGNWYNGVANRLNPDFSIFCSDPDRFGVGHRLNHPHRAVWRDFFRYGRVQVDEHIGCHINARIGM